MSEDVILSTFFTVIINNISFFYIFPKACYDLAYSEVDEATAVDMENFVLKEELKK